MARYFHIPKTADPELNEWAHRAFRPAKLQGDLRAMRAKARAAPGWTGAEIGIAMLLGATALGLGVLIGRWWKKRETTSSYLMGLDALSAPYEALAKVSG